MTARQISCAALFLVIGLAAGVDLDCPPFWTRFGDHCYRFFRPTKSWQAAEEHCQEFFSRKGQGHLASIHTAEENNFLIQMWQTLVPREENYVNTHVWLGHTDQTKEGTFSWSDGTGFYYQAWRDGQPNNSGQGEDCGTFWNHGNVIGWNDDRCRATLPYICKMPINKE
ncbi:echinoidin-like [Acanthaster planci]|uniref:Echinoidin-like n=1 Tax=Acanthaster planci TaxID=133434 RepID=A0A8B7ZN26_ACAPL|nr:echinoidin-like [Acanthaster planci]